MEGTTRVTVQEAARLLGISEGAVRARIHRGTLETAREGGTVYVRIDADDTSKERSKERTEQTELVQALREHNTTLERQLNAEREASAELRRIIAALTQRIPEIEPPRNPVEHLEDEEALREEAEMEARDAETRHSGHFQRYGAPRRETLSEPPGAREMVADEQQGRGPIPDAPGAQEGAERPWWRRVFGG